MMPIYQVCKGVVTGAAIASAAGHHPLNTNGHEALAAQGNPIEQTVAVAVDEPN